MTVLNNVEVAEVVADLARRNLLQKAPVELIYRVFEEALDEKRGKYPVRNAPDSQLAADAASADAEILLEAEEAMRELTAARIEEIVKEVKHLVEPALIWGLA